MEAANMQPFVSHNGIIAPLSRVNVDTDQIIPKQFLKRIERSGFGQFLFFDWRFMQDGSPNPDFVLNQPQYTGASILVAGRNFGSGSSREHAPWALMDYGFKCIIAPSFADIFYSNCFQNGILPVTLPEKSISKLIKKAKNKYTLTVDLKNQKVYDQSKAILEGFEIDPYRRHALMNGLDEIGMTLQNETLITKFEETRNPDLPHT